LNTDDLTLIKDLQSGSTQKRDSALHFFYSNPEVRSWVHSYIQSHGGQESDADDVFQDAIIVFDRNIREGKFQGKSSLKTYLLAIVKWTWLGHQRKKGFTIELQPEANYELEDSFDDDFMSKERSTLIEAAIDHLDQRCQELLRHYKLDYSMKEIASMMSFSNPDMAKKQAYRCREKLRNYFLGNPSLLKALNINVQ
jgi:RNA polymerase sigma factor (sigma-70 family)